MSRCLAVIPPKPLEPAKPRKPLVKAVTASKAPRRSVVGSANPFAECPAPKFAPEKTEPALSRPRNWAALRELREDRLVTLETSHTTSPWRSFSPVTGFTSGHGLRWTGSSANRTIFSTFVSSSQDGSGKICRASDAINLLVFQTLSPYGTTCGPLLEDMLRAALGKRIYRAGKLKD